MRCCSTTWPGSVSSSYAEVGRSSVQVDAQALVEERHLLEAGAQRLVVEVDGLEDRGVRPERDRRAGLVALLGALERGVGNAAVAVGLPPDVALALDLDVEPARERVDDGRADAVQTAGDGVAAAAELAAGVQHGQDDLDGRLALGLVDVDGDAAAVVDDAHRAVGQDRDDDRVAVAGQRLVDRVVDDLVAPGGADRAGRSSRCTCPGACGPPRVLRGPGSRRHRTRRESVRLALVPRNAVRVPRERCRGSQTS